MKKENVVKWVATIITLCGAVCTSFGYDPLNIYFLNVGAFLFMVWGIMIKETSMIVVNGGLLVIYIVGFVHRFY